MTRPLVARWCADADGLAVLAGEWNALLSRSTADNVFLTWEWITTWWRHFGGGQDLWVLELRDPEGRLRAIAPLKRRTGRGRLGRVRYVEFIGSRGPALPDHLNFICEPGDEEPAIEAVLAALDARRSEWDLLFLEGMILDSAPAKALAVRLRARRRWRHLFRSTVCPYLPLPATWEELEAGLQGSLKKNLRYNMRRAEKKGAHIDIRETRAELDDAFAELERLHQLRMEDTDRGGNFRNPAYADFHRELMDTFAGLGWLDLRFMVIQGRPIAVEYGFRYGGRLYGYQLGFDPKHGSLSPGSVLLAWRLQQLIAEGMKELDMLRGRGAYKYYWTQLYRENHAFVMPRPGPGGARAYLSDLLALSPPILLKRLLAPDVFERVYDSWLRLRRRLGSGRRATGGRRFISSPGESAKA